jgi:hypothetical protein
LARLLFFLLLLASLGLTGHLWLTAQGERTDFAGREKNRDEVRIAAVTPPAIAARSVEDARKTQQNLAGAACVEFSGIAPNDAPRAREAFNALQLGTRLAERRVEDIRQYWVFLPAAPDRRTAESRMAELRRQGVTDLSLRPDNAISLGVFSTEEAARRFLTNITARGVRNAEQGPFTRELRELVMLVRDPDTELVARLTIMQRDYPTSTLRAVPCP